MRVPAICSLKLMICTQCSQAIEWIARASTGRSSDRGGAHNDRAGLAGFHGDLPRVGVGGVEYGSASRSGSGGVRLCIAAWTHKGRDADCPPTGPVAHGQRCQSRLSGALWRPPIAERSPASGTSDDSFFDDAGRKTHWMGISGRRQLRDASVARCATRQQRADLRSCCPRRPWPDFRRHSWGLADTWRVERLWRSYPIFVDGRSPCPSS